MRENDNKQIKMDHTLYEQMTKYLQENNLSIEDFAKLINVSAYMVGKVYDRKIQMSCYPSLLIKIQTQLSQPLNNKKRIWF